MRSTKEFAQKWGTGEVYFDLCCVLEQPFEDNHLPKEQQRCARLGDEARRWVSLAVRTKDRSEREWVASYIDAILTAQKQQVGWLIAENAIIGSPIAFAMKWGLGETWSDLLSVARYVLPQDGSYQAAAFWSEVALAAQIGCEAMREGRIALNLKRNAIAAVREALRCREDIATVKRLMGTGKLRDPEAVLAQLEIEKEEAERDARRKVFAALWVLERVTPDWKNRAKGRRMIYTPADIVGSVDGWEAVIGE